jgi:hypothetical protein
MHIFWIFIASSFSATVGFVVGGFAEAKRQEWEFNEAIRKVSGNRNFS